MASVHETVRIKSAAWDESGVLLYTTLNHLKYCLPNGDTGIVCTLAEPVYLTYARGPAVATIDRDVAVAQAVRCGAAGDRGGAHARPGHDQLPAAQGLPGDRTAVRAGRPDAFCAGARLGPPRRGAVGGAAAGSGGGVGGSGRQGVGAGPRADGRAVLPKVEESAAVGVSVRGHRRAGQVGEAGADRAVATGLGSAAADRAAAGRYGDAGAGAARMWTDGVGGDGRARDGDGSDDAVAARASGRCDARRRLAAAAATARSVRARSQRARGRSCVG
eukprot:ctg_5213.g440